MSGVDRLTDESLVLIIDQLSRGNHRASLIEDAERAARELLAHRRASKASPAPSDGLRVPKTLSAAQVADACMSHRHDYGLMIGEEKELVRREAAEWWRCFENTLNDPPAHLRAALTPAPAQEAGDHGPYTCRCCTAATWNDSDVCDDCINEASHD